MSRFTDYQALADGRSLMFDWRYDIVTSSGIVLASTHPTGDEILLGATVRPMSFQHDRISERSATMTIVADDPCLCGATESSIVNPQSDNRYRVYAGVLDPGAGEWTWWLIATLVADELETVHRGSARFSVVTLVDRTRSLRTNLSTSWGWHRGVTPEGVIANLVAEVHGSAQIMATGYFLPAGQVPAGTERYSLITEMLESCGQELYVTETGAVRTRVVPDTDDDPTAERWRYGVGGIPIEEFRETVSRSGEVGWKIQAGGLQSSVQATDLVVYDTDPRSRSMYSGIGETPISTSKAPWAETTGQAAEAGYAQLRRNSAGPGIVTFTTAPNPAMQVHDLVDIVAGDTNGPHRVIGIRLPLETDGLMTVTARGCWDPALNYVPQPDVGLGTNETVEDQFDRADEPLENLFPPEGLYDWTGGGWAIRNQEAVQLSPDAWSMAFILTPMLRTNVDVLIRITALPPGRRVGPVARCTGQFEGYAALIDSAGVCSLELWQSGQLVRTLASYDTGESPVGKFVALTAAADGRLIVRVGDGDVIDITDDSLGGTHVGMLGYGGDAGDAPAVDYFYAG